MFSFGITYGSACSQTICRFGALIINLINGVAVPVIFALAFIVFLWGVANAYIFSGGDSAKVRQGHQLILWGLIGFVAMLSLWGLVNIVANTLGISGGYGPSSPTYYPTPSAGGVPSQTTQPWAYYSNQKT